MCKESALVTAIGRETVEAQQKNNAKGNYRVMRKGKTRKDHASGAWANRLSNRLAKALENRGFHGKKA